MRCLPLLLLLSACQGPDEISISPWYGTGQSTWSGEGRDYTSHESGAMFTATWYMGDQRVAYENLAALDVSKAGQLTLRDDHHSAAPIIITPPAPVADLKPDSTPPALPERDWFAPFKKVPETLEESLLLGIYVMIAVGALIAAVRAVLALKRGGVLEMLPFFKKDK